MKRIIGVALATVKVMTRGEYNKKRGWELPKDENGADEGYFVDYWDMEHKNWFPKDELDAISNENGSLTFGEAIEFAKRGFKVSRSGWNGKGMFVFLSDPDGFVTTDDTHITRAVGKGVYVGLPPMFIMKTAIPSSAKGGVILQQGWLASQADMLSKDWGYIDEGEK